MASTVAYRYRLSPDIDIDQTEILRRHRAGEAAITVDGEARRCRWPFVDDSANPHLGMLLSRLLSLRFETLMGFCAASDGHTVNDEIAQSGIYVILTVKVSLMDVMPRG